MLVKVLNDLISPVHYFLAHIDLLVAQLISDRYAENGLIVEEDDSLVPCVSDEDLGVYIFYFGCVCVFL